MAGSKSNFLELEIMDHVLGNSAYTAPASVFVALYTSAPSDTGGGTEVSTGAWSNYARAGVANNATNFPAASGTSNVKQNGTTISFGTATVPGTAPVVVAFGVFDAATSGNLLLWADLASNKTIDNGDAVSFAAGALTWSED